MNQILERKSLRDRFFVIGIVIVVIILLILTGSLLKSFYEEYKVIGSWEHKGVRRSGILTFYFENSWELKQSSSRFPPSIAWGTWEREGLLIIMKTNEVEIWAKIDKNGITLPTTMTRSSSPLLFKRVKE